MLILALLAAAQAAPVPGEIKTFGDWAVACDNTKRCEMTSLIPGDSGFAEEGSGYDVFQISIARAAGPAGGFTVEIDLSRPRKGTLTLDADGKPVASGMAQGDGLVFTGAEAERIVAAIVRAKQLTLGGGKLSLAGSSAALRYIDAGQGRAGTVTAAVAKGSRPPSAVPAARPAPAIAAVRPSGRPAAVDEEALFARERDCREAYEGGAIERPKVETHALGGGATLALLPCGAGAYNFMTVPFVIRGGKAELARFDSGVPGMSEGNAPSLVNAGFESGRLSSYSKGRGIGDCGVAEEWAWDGTMFRLVESRIMSECRGSTNWLAVWRAEAVAR